MSGVSQSRQTRKGIPKANSPKFSENQAISTLNSVEVSPHAQQLFGKRGGKFKRGRTAAKAHHKPKDTKPSLRKDDEKLAKAIDRINANHEITRGLLFQVAQKIPEARELVLES